MNRRLLTGVLIASILPTVITWLYFVALEGHPLQKLAFGAKVVQFAFPLVWIVWVLRERLQDSWISKVPKHQSNESDHVETSEHDKNISERASVLAGIAMGVAVTVAMWFIYRAIPVASLASLTANAKDKVQQLGFASAPLFLGLGVFYSLIHSFLEEYYFRWFVFGQLRRLTSQGPAMVISGLAFASHHVIILVVYFGWSLLAAFLSLSIAVGGAIWAYHYEKSKSLLGPWLSHLIVDAGIFAVGYHLLRDAGAL